MVVEVLYAMQNASSPSISVSLEPFTSRPFNVMSDSTAFDVTGICASMLRLLSVTVMYQSFSPEIAAPRDIVFDAPTGITVSVSFDFAAPRLAGLTAVCDTKIYTPL